MSYCCCRSVRYIDSYFFVSKRITLLLLLFLLTMMKSEMFGRSSGFISTHFEAQKHICSAGLDIKIHTQTQSFTVEGILLQAGTVCGSAVLFLFLNVTWHHDHWDGLILDADHKSTLNLLFSKLSGMKTHLFNLSNWTRAHRSEFSGNSETMLDFSGIFWWQFKSRHVLALCYDHNVKLGVIF